ncbi:Protein argonaute-2 [Elasticomyces elasticus]|nr:Protein argonaute-2 [Elasticomyces elasticus]
MSFSPKPSKAEKRNVKAAEKKTAVEASATSANSGASPATDESTPRTPGTTEFGQGYNDKLGGAQEDYTTKVDTDATALADKLEKASLQDSKAKTASTTLPDPDTVYQYDLRVIGSNGEIEGSLKKEICKAFSKEVCPQQLPDVVSKASNSSFLALHEANALQRKFTLRVHSAPDMESMRSGHKDAYVKVHEQQKNGETVKKWVLIDTLKELEKFRPQTQLLQGANIEPDLGRTITKWRSDGTGQSVSDDVIQEFASQKKTQLMLTTTDWTDTFVVFAKRIEHKIGRSSMLNTVCNGAEHSGTVKAVNHYMTNKLVAKGSLQLGNRVFGMAERLEYGLEFRKGEVVKPTIQAADAKLQVDKKDCTQYFFQNIPVSKFLIEHFGPSTTLCDPAKADELTKVLKGAHVIVATNEGDKVRSIKSVTHDSAKSLPICHASSGGPIPLAELYEQHCGKTLKYPDMACINVGSGERDFFVPAEACMLVKDQPFKHQLPVFIEAKDFGNAVKIMKTQHLDVVFAEVFIDSNRRPDMDQQWSTFKSELKSRFDNLISKSARDDDLVLLPYVEHKSQAKTHARTESWVQKLSQAVHKKSEASAKTVIIVAVPAGKHNTAIYNELKKICDMEIGVQCKVIRTNVLSKVVKDPEKELKVFTGAIVRNLLPRILRPAAIDPKNPNKDEYELRFPTPSEVAENGILFGIDVQVVEGSRFMDSDGKVQYHTGIATITSSSVSEGSNVRTTYSPIPIDHGKVSATALKILIHTHGAALPDASHVVYYRSGEGAGDEAQLQKEWTGIMPGEKKRMFIAYVPENIVQLKSGSEAIELDGTITKTDMQHMANPYGLNSNFRKVFARDPKQVLEATHTYILTHNVQGSSGNAKCRSVLTNTSVPDILYLAQEAGKYAQRYAEIDGTTAKFLQVKEELRSTLYYI